MIVKTKNTTLLIAAIEKAHRKIRTLYSSGNPGSTDNHVG